MPKRRIAHIVQERAGGGNRRNCMSVFWRNAVDETPAGRLRQVSRHVADLERVGQPRAHGVMRLQGKYVRLVLQSPYGRAENDPSEVLFEFGPVTRWLVRRAGALAADQLRPFHYLHEVSLASQRGQMAGE